MYLNQIILKSLEDEFVVPRIGDELVEPGLPAHKRSYVGPIGPNGEDVVDPVKGQPAQFVQLKSIPNWQHLLVGERGPKDCYRQDRAQERAWEVVTNGVVNRTLGPNCEHITSYIRTGGPKSSQLMFWGGVAAAVAFGVMLGGAD